MQSLLLDFWFHKSSKIWVTFIPKWSIIRKLLIKHWGNGLELGLAHVWKLKSIKILTLKVPTCSKLPFNNYLKTDVVKQKKVDKYFLREACLRENTEVSFEPKCDSISATIKSDAQTVVSVTKAGVHSGVWL